MHFISQSVVATNMIIAAQTYSLVYFGMGYEQALYSNCGGLQCKKTLLFLIYSDDSQNKECLRAKPGVFVHFHCLITENIYSKLDSTTAKNRSRALRINIRSLSLIQLEIHLEFFSMKQISWFQTCIEYLSTGNNILLIDFR